MADLGTLRPGANDTTGLPTGSNALIASPGSGATDLADDSDATFDAQTTNTSGTYEHGRALGDTPGDFGSMDTCAIRVRVAWESAPSNSTWDDVLVRIMDSAGTTVLAGASSTPASAWQSCGNPAESATPELLPGGGPGSFAYVNTGASKTQWDGALIQFQYVRTRNKGGDALGMRMFEAFVTGTYTAGATQKAGSDAAAAPADASTLDAAIAGTTDTAAAPADASSLAADLTATTDTAGAITETASAGVPIDTGDVAGTPADASVLDADLTATTDTAAAPADAVAARDIEAATDTAAAIVETASAGVPIDTGDTAGAVVDALFELARALGPDVAGAITEGSQLDVGGGLVELSAGDTAGAVVDSTVLDAALAGSDVAAAIIEAITFIEPPIIGTFSLVVPPVAGVVLSPTPIAEVTIQ